MVFFNDAPDVILTSQTGISDKVDNVNDNESPLVAMKCQHYY